LDGTTFALWRSKVVIDTLVRGVIIPIVGREKEVRREE
jgi:hypothetical protein